ncbi:CCR4-NOT transcription complex subunit 4-like isoform X2 [Tachypleus tridentatus]|uniref:CCR4-NOT transcription complex subunit 4-like isoform X2 n=1 Tax=Tachypleus tridentatus TaxID=6853 RepID=UPI003FD29CF3
MSSSQDQILECPLCMEPLEMDDINFYPCTCGYQICRFCWHRIRTDENGLCPACRKQYPEDPADFKPLTQQELQRIKTEKKQKDLQRKQKISENRKHLANLRVVQKNLVFVVGLPPRLAEAEVLKKHDYFGKFGKIHKVVVNHSTSYAGSQGPSASAYVTYYRGEDALKAIQAVNNIHVDGRTLKASLGTTKYCSHFLKNQQCPKSDCMYLHELGDELASFTKEEMQQGKHQEYERKLYEQVLGGCNHLTRRLSSSPTNNTNNGQTTREGWPTLQHYKSEHRANGLTKCVILSQHGVGQKSSAGGGQKRHNSREEGNNGKGRDRSSEKSLSRGSSSHSNSSSRESLYVSRSQPTPPTTGQEPQGPSPCPIEQTSEMRDCSTEISQCNRTENHTLPTVETPKNDPSVNSKLGGALHNGLPTSSCSADQESGDSEENWIKNQDIDLSPENIPVQCSTDWQAAFGFTSSNHRHQDDELGFDPWDESAKGLADLLEKEATKKPHLPQLINHRMDSVHPSLMTTPGYPNHSVLNSSARRVAPPPGFGPSHINKFVNIPTTAFSSEVSPSKMMSLINMPPNNHIVNGPSSFQEQMPPLLAGFTNYNKHVPAPGVPPVRPKFGNAFVMKDWQESLRSLFPNINISFGPPTTQTVPTPTVLQNPKGNEVHPVWNPHGPSWVNEDPAILSSGSITDSRSDSPPHWMKSLQQMTVEDGSINNHNCHVQFPMPFAYRAQWPGITHPPGFWPSTEPQTFAENI